jgi:hypothetical protein
MTDQLAATEELAALDDRSGVDGCQLEPRRR